MDRRLFIGAAASGVGLALAGAGRADEAGGSIGPDDMVLGSPRAKVTVIEYASASCPHCARFNNEVFPAFKARYIDTGRVRYVFREFLTQPVELAAASFLIARCAGKDKYFRTLDAIFHAQAEIYATGDAHGHFVKIARAAGMDEAALDACLADAKALDALNARVDRYASRDRVNGTPTFLINGARLEGEQPLTTLDAAITAAEARAGPTRGQRHGHRRG